MTEYFYDPHGNMTKMPHLQELMWDYADNLKEVTLDASGNTAYYVYDANGDRVRKVILKNNGTIIENRFYIVAQIIPSQVVFLYIVMEILLFLKQLLPIVAGG